MMRVLHVVATNQRRGAEVFASDLVRSLGEAGVSQRVAILRARDNGAAVTYDAPTTSLAGAGRVLPVARVDLGTVRSLRAVIAHWRPSVIQAHGGEALKYTALGGGPGRLVYRRIGATQPKAEKGIAHLGHRALIRRAARVIAVAEATRRETISTFGISPRNIVTIPGGVDSRRLRPGRDAEAVRDELGIPRDATVILSLGAFTWEKDPVGHIRALTPVLQEIPGSVHVLAGDGPMRSEVDRAVRSSGLGDRIRVLGSRADIADLLAASDVMLVASRTEGMPGCLIEAGMAGLPAVAYAVGGVLEVVEDEVTGLVVAQGDEDGLRRSFRRLLPDPSLRREMGRAAQQRCGSRFDISVVAPRYLELYGEVVGRG